MSSSWIDLETCEEVLAKPAFFLMAMDGSDASTAGLSYLTDIFMQRDHRDTRLEVLHIYDDSKDYLPPKCRKEHIKEIVEVRLASSVSSKRWHFTLQKKADVVHVGQQINDFIQKCGADFTVMGYYGAKGKKVEIVGKQVLEVLQHSPSSVIIIKDDNIENMPVGRPTKYAVSVSINKASTKAFLDALHLSQPGDEIHLVFVRTQQEVEMNRNFAAQVRQHYFEVFDDLKNEDNAIFNHFGDRLMKFHVLDQRSHTSIAKTLVDFLDELQPDFVAMGTQAMRVEKGKESVGSVTLDVVATSSCNVIVSFWVDLSKKVFDQHIRPPSRAV